ncbi:MAG: ATP-dependent zinc metalloprotease FtsH [Longimicrobiales bacterium]
MEQDRRKNTGDRRRKDRGSPDRRRRPPVLEDRRTRFSIFYFLLALAILIGVNVLLGRTESREIAYNELKDRIRAGQVDSVLIGVQTIHASIADSLVTEGTPAVLATTRVTDDPSFIPLLDSARVDYAAAPESRFGNIIAWMLPFALLLLLWVWMMRRINPAQNVMTVGRNRARIMGEEGTGITFEDVAGADEAKAELVEVVDFLRTPDKFARVGARIPKGVLLIGPPGTGKTLLARAVAGEAGVTFFSISGSEFVEMFVGVGAARVRDLFEQAKSNAPCIVFIDELDALGKARGVGGPMGGNEEREQTLNQLLVEMDGFDPRRGVLIMGATNRPETLDPALLRPGRFDRQVVVDRPDRIGRTAILQVHADSIEMSDAVDLELVARRTPGFVGADLANLLNEAALLAARRDSEQVEMHDIEEAIDRVTAGLEKKNRLLQESERRIVAFHEAGHAIVAERVKHADPVHKISIIPRGIAALGYTQQLPEDDRYLIQRAELDDRMAVLLGGRAAEELVFGEISTGAGNDLERASEMARRMVGEFGMSEIVGPVTFHRRRQAMLSNEMELDRSEFSEATAQQIDGEVRRLLVEAYQRAFALLRDERDVLDAVAERLLEAEVVDREELRALMGEPPHQAGDGRRPRVGHVAGSAAD